MLGPIGIRWVGLLVLCGLSLLPHRAAAQTAWTQSAGEFVFTSPRYYVTDVEGLPGHGSGLLGVRLTVTRLNGARGRVLVDYRTVDIEEPDPEDLEVALPDEQYVPATGTLIFDDYQMSASFVVSTLGPWQDGARTKTFQVELSNPRPAPEENPFEIQPVLGLISQADVQIDHVGHPTFTDPDGARQFGFSFERANYQVGEGGSITIRVVRAGFMGNYARTNYPQCSVTVDLSRNAGLVNAIVQAGSFVESPENQNATQDLNWDDWTSSRGLTFTLDFAEGQTAASFSIDIVNDRLGPPLVEFNEDIIMQLKNPCDGGSKTPLGVQQSATVTILFDDQPAGAVDRTWNPDGSSAQNPPYNPYPGANSIVHALVVQPDGRTIVAGQFTAYNTVPRNRIARINEQPDPRNVGDGFIDHSFDPGTGADGPINALVLYPTNHAAHPGKVLVGGAFTAYNNITRYGICRINANGSLDPNFNPGNGVDGNVQAVALQSDDKVIIAGDFLFFNDVERHYLARLNSDGSLDTSFEVLPDGPVNALAIDSAGRILLGGGFYMVDDQVRPGVARLNPDGSLDTTFDPRGGASSTVFALAVQPDDRVLIGGAFGSYDFRPSSGIARLNADGTLDLTFAPGVGANDAVYSIVLQPDGRILVGGAFTFINYTRRVGLARLFADGTVDTEFMDQEYNQFAGFINPFSFEPNNYVLAIGLQTYVRDLIDLNGTLEPSNLIWHTNVMVGGSFMLVGGGSTRDDEHNRQNVTRLIGGITRGSGNLGYASPTYTVDENGLSLPVTLTRINGGRTLPVPRLTALAATSNNTATAGMDFNDTVVRVGSGITMTIPIQDDALVEGNETFDLAIYEPETTLLLGGENIGVGAALHRYQAQSTIVENDGFPGRFAFSAPVYSQVEGGTVATITVRRLDGSFGAVSVDFYALPGTATANVDYTPTNGTLLFPAGTTTRTFRVPITKDNNVEQDESIFLLLTNATGGSVLDYSTVDPTFDPVLGANEFVNSIAFCPDLPNLGKVVIGGNFTSVNGVANKYVARLNADGTVDTTFPATLELDGPVYAVAVQGDGRIIVAGEFTTVDGNPFPHVARLNVDGTLDPTFDVSAWGGPDAAVRSVALMTDGSVVIGGDFYFNTRVPFLTKLLTDGSEDPNFAVDGLMLDGAVHVVTVNTNNDIFFGGDFTGVGGFPDYARFAMVSALGVVYPFPTAMPPEAKVRSIAVMTDQRVVVGGENVSTGPSPHLIRLNMDLTPDATFGIGTGPNAPVLALAAHTLGVYANKVVLGGRFTSVNGLPRNYLARLNLDGLVDESFVPTPGPNAPVLATVLQPDSRLLIGGEFTTVNVLFRNHVARISPALAALTIVDDDLNAGKASFTSLGFTTNENAGAATITVQRLGGSSGIASVQVVTSDGTATNGLDYVGVTNILSWNSGDVNVKSFTVPLLDDSLVEPIETVYLTLRNPVNLALGNLSNAVLSIENDDFAGRIGFSLAQYTVTENSALAVITVTRSGGVAGTASIRFAAVAGTAVDGVDFAATNGVLNFADGESSKAFGVPIKDDTAEDGSKTVQMSLSDVNNAALGTIVNAVLTILDDELLNVPAGSIDPTFDVQVGANDSVYSVAVQPDGRILMAGDFTQVNGVTRNRVARLYDLGSLDGLFNMGAGPNGPVRALALQDDGRILIGGFFTSIGSINRNRIARLGTDGTVDIYFDPGGGADNTVYSIALAPDGKMVIGGAFTRVNGIVRPSVAMLNTNGAVYTAFNAGAGPNKEVFAVAIQSDGKILVGGDFETVNNIARLRLARLKADGSLDSSFSVGAGFNGTVRAIEVQSDGRILVGGSFTAYNGSNCNYLCRLEKNGALDGTFMAGQLGANNPVYALALQDDEKIIVGGDFTLFNGVTRHRITRLNQNGSTDTTINFGTGANSFVASLAIQPDSQILIGGGFTRVNEQPAGRIARLFGGSMSGVGRLEFAAPNFDVDEYATNGIVTVRRIGGTTGQVSVNQTISPGTALAGEDYLSVTNTLIFPPGEVIRSLAVPIRDDNFIEPPEVANLALSSPSNGATLGLQPIATLTIVNDDSVVQLDRQSYREPEDTISGRATLTLVRSFATNSTITVDYGTTTNFTITTVRPAAEYLDFIPTNGTVTFAPGEVSKNVFVTLLNNNTNDGNRMFAVVIGNPVALAPSKTAVLGTNVLSTVTIVDDEYYPGDFNFSQAQYQVQESNTNLVITVRRDRGSSGIASVNFSILGGTATPDGDYGFVSGTLGFADGQNLNTFTIPIYADLERESDETVLLGLSSPTGGAKLGTNTTPVLIILNVGGIPTPGTVIADFRIGTGANNLIRTVAIQPDGKLVIGGAFTRFNSAVRNYIARLNWDGSLDTSFNPGLGADGLVASVSLDPDGKVLMGGAFQLVNLTNRVRVARLDPFASVDSGFYLPGGVNATVYAVAPHQGGAIIAGLFNDTGSSSLARLNSDGSLDNSFNSGLNVDGPVYGVAVQPDGRVILGGNFTNVNGVARRSLARLNANGTLDASFGTAPGVAGIVFSVALQNNGSVVIGGEFSSVNSVSNQNNVARLTADGMLDAAFAPLSGADARVYSVAVQSNGKILIGGDFTTFNGISRNRIARLNTDGTLDTGFVVGTGANSTVYAVGLQPDQRVILAGDFTQVDGQARNGIAQLLGGEFFDVNGLSIAGIQRSLGGTVTITITSEPGHTYTLDYTTDFATWNVFDTKTAIGNTLDFVDTAAPGQRFYRARRSGP